MPDLGTTSLINSETLTLIPHPTMLNSPNSTHTIYPIFPAKTLNLNNDNFNSKSELPISSEMTTNQVSSSSSRAGVLKIRFTRMKSGDGDCNGGKKSAEVGKCLEDYVQDWKDRKIASGVPENQCFFPFLMGSPRLVECRICSEYIHSGDEISCSVRGCPGIYHVKCAKDKLRYSVLKKLKCPQHACFLCKNKYNWRCVRCELSAHDKCAAWPEKVIHLSERSGWAICWKHPKDWHQKKTEAPANTFEEIFSRLPLPYIEEEFSVESTLKDISNDKVEPPAYVHIRRNVYLVKKKRDDACVDIGCTNCTSPCYEDCVCRVQCISCSKFCGCSDECTNKPFRKEKKIKLVKTELCGWGVEAAESINKGDFIIEYVGEVVDDVACTQRLWDMKNKNVTNFYMCEIRKDFTIDATFKGNLSRFLNHSCDPNCKLEKWQVEGETRVGVFAARSIKLGEPLTYDYRFVQFGAEVKCHCGATNCQGYLDAKRKTNLDILKSKRMHRVHLPEGLLWGLKRKRSLQTSLTLAS